MTHPARQRSILHSRRISLHLPLLVPLEVGYHVVPCKRLGYEVALGCKVCLWAFTVGIRSAAGRRGRGSGEEGALGGIFVL